MAQLDQPFDASQVDMGADTSIPIPSGFFQAKITASDLKQTRAGGTMIELELTLLSAGYAGRKAGRASTSATRTLPPRRSGARNSRA